MPHIIVVYNDGCEMIIKVRLVIIMMKIKVWFNSQGFGVFSVHSSFTESDNPDKYSILLY